MAKDPFRLRVMKALTACLEGITPANGYQHDLTGKVFRGRNVFSDNDALPLLSILEAPDDAGGVQTPMPNQGTTQAGPWDLLVQGFVDDDFLNPTDPAHVLMAEVKQRLVAERTRERQYNILGMGGRVVNLQISPGVVRPTDEFSNKAYFYLRLTLEIVEDMANPYE